MARGTLATRVDGGVMDGILVQGLADGGGMELAKSLTPRGGLQLPDGDKTARALSRSRLDKGVVQGIETI